MPTKKTSAADVVAELEAAGKVTQVNVGGERVELPKTRNVSQEGTLALAPGLIKFRKHEHYPLGRIKNPDVKFEDLPTKAEILDPVTHRAQKGMRYRKTKVNADGKVFEVEMIEF